MSNNIVIYNNGQGTIGSLVPALQKSFNGLDATPAIATPHHIHNGILKQPETKLFILPGIAGETSNYTDELNTDALNEIFEFANRGGVILSICAGSYFLSRQTVYSPAWGATKTRFSTAPLFNGVAHGPVSVHAKAPGDEPRFGHVTVVPVEYKTLQGDWQQAHVCYGNGPGLYPDDETDTGLEILARYENGPAALLRQQIGKGALYMSCILPEIGYQSIANAPKLESARRLMKLLQPHEEQRHQLWASLTNRMKRDLT